MRNDLKLYFFDMDGTLLCPGGKKLQKGAAELLEYINTTGGQVVFISGSNYTEIRRFLNLVYKYSNLNDQNFHPIIASNGGSNIPAIDYYVPISTELLDRIKKVTYQIDPTAIFVYRTQKNTFIDSVWDTESVGKLVKKGSKKLVTDILVKARLFTLDSVVLRKTQIDALVRNELVLSLNILSFKSKEIAISLLEQISEVSASASGPYIDLSRTNKLDVIRHFVITNKISRENCAMFGDSYNDEDALLFCGVGFLCNPKKDRGDLLERVTTKRNHYATDDLTVITDALRMKGFDPVYLENKTAQMKKSMKKPKEINREF